MGAPKRRDGSGESGWSPCGWEGERCVGADVVLRDNGRSACDDGEIEVYHPAIQPTRHAEFYRFQARNRVWLARRNLPAPVGALYLLAWTGVSAIRLRSRAAWRETLRGYQIGLAKPAGERRPLSWRTIWRMTRAGHPPVI